MKVSLIASVDLGSRGVGANYIQQLLGGFDDVEVWPAGVRSGANVRVIVPNSVEAAAAGRAAIEQDPIPTITVIWDEMEFILSGMRHMRSQAIGTTAIADYRYILGATDFCISMTEEMSRRLRSCGLDSPVVAGPYSAPLEMWEVGDRNLIEVTARERSGLVLPGSGYAWREINELLKVLAVTEQNLTVIGTVSRLVRKRSGFKLEPSVPEAKLGSTLGRFTAGYVPYWRMGPKSKFVASAYPSKLSVCLASGIPVLYHGPESGSPSKLLKDRTLGTSVQFATEPEIQRFMREANQQTFMDNFAEARSRLRAGPLGPGALGRLFREAVETVSV